jgi:hypothetical protein
MTAGVVITNQFVLVGPRHPDFLAADFQRLVGARFRQRLFTAQVKPLLAPNSFQLEFVVIAVVVPGHRQSRLCLVEGVVIDFVAVDKGF